MARLLLVLLLPALSGLNPLPGDDTKTHKVVCPVDGTKFTAVEIVRAYWWGGTDKDWCRHTFRSRPLESMVWVCPGCKFAGGKDAN